MILITDDAEKNLLDKAKQAHDARQGGRCLHINLNQFEGETPNGTALFKKLGEICTHKSNPLFQLWQKDLFFFDDAITLRKVKLILQAINADESLLDYCTIYDLTLESDALIALCENLKAQRDSFEEFKMAQAVKKRMEEIELILASPEVEGLLTRRNRRKNPEMLIIEDDHFTQKLIAKTVDPRINVTFADNARDALLHYIALAPDMVLLDIGLPDLDGHEVMKHILTLDEEAYIVMLSGNADTRNVLKSVENGAQGFIGKPFNRTRLSSYAQKSPFIQSKLGG